MAQKESSRSRAAAPNGDSHPPVFVGDQAAQAGAARGMPISAPAFRRLRAYAFDPSLSLELDFAGLNQVTLKVPWECDPETGEDLLGPGPVGEYLEVVDCDPASNCFYAPVDLDAPYVLAQDGLEPS